MAVGCGAKFAKIMLIIFNIIFLASGIVLIALGIWLLVTLAQAWGPSQIFSIAGDSYLFRNSAILLIAMGCFILFVTILGLVAAIKESPILLGIYLILILLIFAGEIAGGVVAIVYKDRVLDVLSRELRNSMNFNSSNSRTTYYVSSMDWKCESHGNALLWDYVQTKLGCCGMFDGAAYNGYGYNTYDYRVVEVNQCNATTWNRSMNLGLQVPLTCCSHGDLNDFNYDNQQNSVNSFNCSVIVQKGCVNKVRYWVIRFSPILIGIGIGFGMLELYGIIFVVCLCMNTGKGFKRF